MKIKMSNTSENEALFFENRRVGEWLNSSEAAKFLGLSPNALRIMVCRGQVKYWKLGSRLRFNKSDLILLLEKGA